jgi:glycosyltransferase involved in cell wall biosynthesis/GT2 family glycosyltransferase
MALPPLPSGGDRPLSILVVNPDVPPADRDAGSLRLVRILELLVADGHRVTLIARRGLDDERAALALERLGIEVHRADPQRLTEAERAQLADVPPLDVEALLARVRPDVAWLSFYEIAETYLPLLRRHVPAARVVIDTVDVHSVREQRAADLSGRGEDQERARRTQQRERTVYAAADALVAVSVDDAAALSELAPDVPVHVIATIHASQAPGPAYAEREGVVFVGNFRHTPNVDAAVHFVSETWPLVREVLPGVQLSLVGTAPPPAVQALTGPDVDVTGWVPETRPYLDGARVSIAPLRFGAGVKGKIAEALACGLPVVTTTIGAEGMDLIDGEHALVADTPRAFADAVVRLHGDGALWERVAARGRERLDAALSPAVAHAALRTLLVDAAPRLFVAANDLSADGALRDVLAGYLGAFAEGDPVSLVIGVGDGADPAALFARLVEALGALGHDPDHIPDVALLAWPEGAVLPAGAVAAPPADWHAAGAAPALAPVTPPPVAVIVRLPEDAADAEVQLAAVAAAGLPEDTELLLVAHEPCAPELEAVLASAPVAATARTVRIGAHLGRRAALQRAVAATAAPTVVVLEPHALPRPGFVAPLVAAVHGGAVLAAPVVDGAHGLRVGDDGALWPREAGAPGAPDALALDCLAATRETWFDAPAALPSRDGHAEAQLAAWATARGPLALVAEAQVRRAPAPPASVLICTRNRSEELEDCVALLIASGAEDVVIVDNASTDATPALAAALADRHPGKVRAVHEARPGLSHARNAAAAAARHDLLLYLDDDARPAPGWLAAAARELARPGVANVGGPIAALWPAEREPEFPAPGLEPLFSVLDRGDVDRTLVPPDVVYGANWGVRRTALDAVGGFDPAFGYGPGVAIGGDEVSIAWRIARAGLGATRFVAAAAVGHRIDAARLTDGYLVRRGFTVGVERVRHAIALDGMDRGKLQRDAGPAASRLARIVQATGSHRVESVLHSIERAPLDPRVRVMAADALGEVAASVLLLGEREATIGPLRLLLSPGHLDGVIEPIDAASALAA